MLCAQHDFRLFLAANSYPQGLPVMPDVVVLGFPRSTFVHIARLVLTHKQVPYTFRDLEPEMGSAPILRCIRSIASRSCSTATSHCTKPARLPPTSTKRSTARRCSPRTCAHARA